MFLAPRASRDPDAESMGSVQGRGMVCPRTPLVSLIVLETQAIGRMATITCFAVLWLSGGAQAQAVHAPDVSGTVQPAEGSAEFSALVARGLAAYRDKRYAEARALIERAHALEPSARTLRVLGLIDFAQDRFDSARQELQASLRDARKPLSSEQRAEVSQLLTWMDESLATLHVHVTPAHADVRLDGKPLPNRDAVVMAGERRLSCSAPGFVPYVQALHLAVAQELSVDVQLLPVSSPLMAADGGTAPVREPATSWWPWIASGTGVVMLAGGGALLGFYLHDRSEVVDAPVGVRLSDIETAHDRAPWLLTGAITLGALGVAALTYGGIAVLSTPATRESREVALFVGAGAVTLRSRF